MDKTEPYSNFFKKLQEFIIKQNEQKKRGLNDYNMVNVVRSETSEVGMHSNVIYSLINPKGLHYQDDLFLQHFIKDVLGFHKDEFGKILSVQAEETTHYGRRIDFTIKSTKYYIGIEMKIHASDLTNQISDYAKDLESKAKEHSTQEVQIYYLTLFGKDASPESCGDVKPKNISFKKHILKWIDSCQNEIRNITNLNEAFENYKAIVQKITNAHKGNVSMLEELILKDQESFELSLKLTEEIEKIKPNIVKDFFSTSLVEGLQKLLSNDEKYKDWNVQINENVKANDIAPIKIVKDENWDIVFRFGFENENFNNGTYGIAIINGDLEAFRRFKSEDVKYEELKSWKNNSKQSIFWSWTNRRYPYASENLIDFKYNAQSVAKEYYSYFTKTLDKLDKEYNLNLEQLNDDFNKFKAQR